MNPLTMKKTILLSLFLIAFKALSAQTHVIVDPMFLRFGILQDFTLSKDQYTHTKMGPYVKLMYGDIKGKQVFYTESIKAGAGIYIRDDNVKYHAGLNYNYFFNTTENPAEVDLSLLKKLSFDLGLSLTLDRLTMIMLTDIINWESCIGFSYDIKYQRCPAMIKSKYFKKHKSKA